MRVRITTFDREWRPYRGRLPLAAGPLLGLAYVLLLPLVGVLFALQLLARKLAAAWGRTKMA